MSGTDVPPESPTQGPPPRHDRAPRAQGPARCPQDHRAGDGQQGRHRPLRAGATGPGGDGPPQRRQTEPPTRLSARAPTVVARGRQPCHDCAALGTVVSAPNLRHDCRPEPRPSWHAVVFRATTVRLWAQSCPRRPSDTTVGPGPDRRGTRSSSVPRLCGSGHSRVRAESPTRLSVRAPTVVARGRQPCHDCAALGTVVSAPTLRHDCRSEPRQSWHG